TLMSYVSYYLVLVAAGWLVLKGDFTAGDFFIAIGMIDQLSWPLISLANILRQLIAVKPVCRRMEEFLAESAPEQTAGTLRELHSGIRFRNVDFSYDGQREILKDFSLSLKKGQKCLLRGPSGCGKTTAVNLLLRYHSPTGGSIELDGVPIEELGSTYGLMTVVRQEAVLFRDTLRNNLTLYRPVPDERLREVLTGVGLSRLCGSLDEPVAEGGVNFSGGERKRLCLARALLRDTEVLILDEPLANLDDATAERIEDLLLSIRGKTVIVVSHQFTESKLPAFDQVVTLH
ncbi:MAG: ABC transporter ATP-binding protein, partial [Oscillospiraceae bacterium]|nr:ABC transporter ATP-binding protein [Oscillospiraceae bacterium]